MAKEHNATFLGPSNSLVPIGSEHAYAFGGVVAVTNGNDQILGFKTGKKYLRCKLTVSNGSGSGDDIVYTVLLNGVITCKWYYNSEAEAVENRLYLIIPPLTTVAVHGDNQSSATGRDHTAWLEGRVYA